METLTYEEKRRKSRNPRRRTRVKIDNLKGCFANITDDDLLRDNGNLYAENKELKKEIERLNNIINECAEDILKEIQENHHLSCGVALAIRQKLIDYRELKGSDKE